MTNDQIGFHCDGKVFRVDGKIYKIGYEENDKMIINNKITIKVNNRTKQWFIDKGYNVTGNGEYIEIYAKDLNKGSHRKIEAKCDYCDRVVKRSYRDYYKSVNKFPKINKYCCENCIPLKIEDIKQYKTKNNLLTPDDKGYWTIESNRINELNNYIKKYKYLDKIDENIEGSRIAKNVRAYDDGGIKGLAVKSGYSLDDVYQTKASRKQIDSLDYIVEQTNGFIKKNDRFPTQNEYKKVIGITTSSINAYGGIECIKKHMKYEDEKDLVDDRGFYNRSLYEYIVAQFLIRNGIVYTREQHPFPKEDGVMRSDFTLKLKGLEDIHCEVWGYSEKDTSKRGMIYNANKNKKMKLYKRYNLSLISMEYDLFQKNYDCIIRELESIFSKYINVPYRELGYIDITPAHLITDEQILKEVMNLSNNKNFLPTISLVIEFNANLYYEIIKRYKTYLNFANKFGKQTKTFSTNKVFWTKQKIFDVFEKMIETYGYVLNRAEIKDKNIIDAEISRVTNGALKFGGMTKCKLDYYDKLIDDNKNIPTQEIEYLKEIAQLKVSYRKNISEDLKQKALDLLNKHKTLKDIG